MNGLRSALSAPGRRERLTDMEDQQNAEQFFRDRGFCQRMGWGQHPALLVVDFSQGFTNPESSLGTDLTREIGETVRVLEASRRAEIPIYYSTISYDEESARGASLWTAKAPALGALRSGSPDVAIDPRLGRREDEPIIVKKFASVFFGTDFSDRLHTAEVDTLIITGCTTSGCVRAAVVDAMQNGFRPMIVREAVGDRLQAAHEQSLIDMHAKYGDVVSVDETLEYLSHFSNRRT
jgi:maleamate amidohydrolase